MHVPSLPCMQAALLAGHVHTMKYVYYLINLQYLNNLLGSKGIEVRGGAGEGGGQQAY